MRMAKQLPGLPWLLLTVASLAVHLDPPMPKPRGELPADLVSIWASPQWPRLP